MATQKNRFYIHGDRYELDKNLYYCAECDVFFEKLHFANDHREDHYTRYKYAVKYVKKIMKSSKEYFYHDDPENLFS